MNNAKNFVISSVDLLRASSKPYLQNKQILHDSIQLTKTATWKIISDLYFTCVSKEALF